MADYFTPLEDRLDKRYTERRELLAHAQFVPDWADVCYRHGYLQAIRDVGDDIRAIRNPEKPPETGEIPSILDQPEEQ